MRPSARLRTVQSLLETFFSNPSYPLDLLAAHHFRKNRYIGSKDRRAIQTILYDIIRDYLSLKYQIEETGGEATVRAVLLLHLMAAGEFDAGLFSGGKYDLDPLGEAELALLKAHSTADIEVPAWARLNCPEWLEGRFKTGFPEVWKQELSALKGRAPLTVRVNTLKSTPKDMAGGLHPLGFQKCSFSPLGFSSPEHINLTQLDAAKSGKIEVQDEGSQIAMLVAGVKPGMQVVDLCAGAGGKTLGLAAEMTGKGQIYAFDIDARRLIQLGKRAQRAVARNIQATPLPGDAKARAALLQSLQGKMDRVILDVPCSGTGAWRRSPDARFRLDEGLLKDYTATQAALLVEGAGLVKPGKQLIYITCSLLAEENEKQIEAFLAANSGWHLMDYRKPLEKRGFAAIPDSASRLRKTLLLTPARHGTDGFFTAILEKP